MANYGTVAGADAYHTMRQNLTWIAEDDAAAKLAALVRASEWIDNNYRTLFPGWKTGERAQVRDWPRTYAYDANSYLIASNVIPDEVERATYEVALRELATPGIMSVDFVAADVIKKAAVEGAVSVEFAGTGSASDAQLVIPAITGILQPILTGGDGSSGLVGMRYRG